MGLNKLQIILHLDLVHVKNAYIPVNSSLFLAVSYHVIIYLYSILHFHRKTLPSKSGTFVKQNYNIIYLCNIKMMIYGNKDYSS